MPEDLTIRPECRPDRDSIASVTRRAFGREAEAVLIDRLRTTDAFIGELSLVAEVRGSVVGHVLLSRATITRLSGAVPVPVLALAPVAVGPAYQRRGIGSALVRSALGGARRLGHRLVIVLGEPAYYGRFGFVPASRYGVRPPFEVPDEAFMLQWLGEGPADAIAGVVQYPEPFSEV